MNLKFPFHKFQTMFKERFRQRSTAGGVVRGSKGSRKEAILLVGTSVATESCVLFARSRDSEKSGHFVGEGRTSPSPLCSVLLERIETVQETVHERTKAVHARMH